MTLRFNDYQEFIETEDLVALAIKGNLFVVDSLNEILECGLTDASIVKRLVGTDIQARADLARLAGFISPGEHAMILGVNSVRNRCAHNKGYRITIQDERQIYESLRERNRYLGHVASFEYDPKRFPETFRFSILVITLLLSVRASKIKGLGPRVPLAETVLGENLLEDWLGKETIQGLKSAITAITKWANDLSKSLTDSATAALPRIPTRRPDTPLRLPKDADQNGNGKKNDVPR